MTVDSADFAIAADRLLFFHIPKTAGTALRGLFARYLGEDRVSANLATMPLGEALIRFDHLTAICGHFRVHQGRTLPADRVSLTVLRDPVDRFLSEYHFRKYDNHRRVVDQRVRLLDIDDFIDQLSASDVEELNLQTSLLYPLGTDSLTALSWPEKTAAAMRALDRFDLIGIQSEMDDLSCMLQARMGWSAGATLERANVTSRRIAPDELSMPSRNKLETLLASDRAVYAHAVECFRQLRRTAILAGAHGNTAPDRATMLSDTPARSVSAAATPLPREFGDRRLVITGVPVAGQLSGSNEVLIGEQLNIYIEFDAHDTVDDITAGIAIRDERGLLVYGTNTWLLGETYRVTPGAYAIKLAFLFRGERGAYTIDANLIRNGDHREGCFHWKEHAAQFYVNESAAPYCEGKVLMDPAVGIGQSSPQGSVEIRRTRVDADHPMLSPGRLNPALTDFSAQVSQLSGLRELSAGTELLVHLELENTGTQIWRALGKRPVCVSYHWHDRAGNVVEHDGLRTSLSRDIAPGERFRLQGLLRAPQLAGNLRLIWSLVQEEVTWFDDADAGSKCSVDVDVLE